MNKFKIKMFILTLFFIIPFPQKASIPSEERTFGLLMWLVKGVDWHNPIHVYPTIACLFFLIIIVHFIVEDWAKYWEK